MAALFFMRHIHYAVGNNTKVRKKLQKNTKRSIKSADILVNAPYFVLK